MTPLLPLILVVFSFNLETSTAQRHDDSITSPSGVTPSKDFSQVNVVRPRLYHGQDKSQISSTKVDQEGKEHIPHIIVGLEIDGREHLIDLTLNKDLIPKGYFEKHQLNGSYVITRPGKNDVELCHFHGKLRGLNGSWAAISTCQGLSGVLHDTNELYYLERATNSSHIHNVDHYIYADTHLNYNFSQGIKETDQSTTNKFQEVKRLKREIWIEQEGYDADTEQKTIELVMVVDHGLYKARGQSLDNVRMECMIIANIVRGNFLPLKINISLVGVVVWTERNEIVISTDSTETVINFAKYRANKLNKDHPNDNAQLLTWTKFDDSTAGVAYKKGVCNKFSLGVIGMKYKPLALISHIVTHEMGHNFGMEHDSVYCHCPDDNCFMGTHNGYKKKHWSSCSKDSIANMSMSCQFRKCLRYTPKWESDCKIPGLNDP